MRKVEVTDTGVAIQSVNDVTRTLIRDLTMRDVEMAESEAFEDED